MFHVGDNSQNKDIWGSHSIEPAKTEGPSLLWLLLPIIGWIYFAIASSSMDDLKGKVDSEPTLVAKPAAKKTDNMASGRSRSGRSSGSTSNGAEVAQRVIATLKQAPNFTIAKELKETKWDNYLGFEIEVGGQQLNHSEEDIQALDKAIDTWASGHEQKEKLIEFVKRGIASHLFTSHSVNCADEKLFLEYLTATAMEQSNEMACKPGPIKLLSEHKVEMTFEYKEGKQPKDFTQTITFNTHHYGDLFDFDVKRQF